MTDQVELKDFSRKREEIRFAVNGTVLRARPRMGLVTAQKVLNLREAISAEGSDKIGALRDIFALLLHSDSVADFERLASDEDDPIDAEQIREMMDYVMERQGLRPTQSSTDLSGTSGVATSGTSGTGGGSPTESTP